MKKRFNSCLCLIAVVLLLTLLSGCGSADAPDKLSAELRTHLEQGETEIQVSIWFEDIELDAVKAQAEQTLGYTEDDIQKTEDAIPNFRSDINETDPDYMLFMIEAPNGRGIFTTAPVFDAGAFDRMDALIGRPVEVTGVEVPFDHSPRLYTERIFKVSDVECIRPLEDAPDARTRVRGHVVAVRKRAGRVILKTDRSEFISVNMADPRLPSCGESIEASGLEETDLFRRTLFNAQWTKLDGPAYKDEDPVAVSPRKLTQDAQGRRKVNCEYYGRPIRVNGTIRSMPEDDPEGRMLLDCDGCPVYVDASALPGVLDGLQENTVVEVSGTCALDVDAPARTLAIPRLRGACTLRQRR